MSDERMRELARRARKTDDPVAELRSWVEARRSGALPEAAGVLVDRLSRGELDRERLALAAYAAHPGALALMMEETAYYAALAGDLAAVHVALGEEPGSYLEIDAWLLGLRRWGDEPVLVAQVAATRRLVRVVEESVRATLWVDDDAIYYRGREEAFAASANALVEASERALHSGVWPDSRSCSMEARRLASSDVHWHWPNVAEAVEETVEAVAARSVLEGSFHMGLCFDALPGASRTRVTPLDAARSITTAVAAWALR